jgi:hypothetical protein
MRNLVAFALLALFVLVGSIALAGNKRITPPPAAPVDVVEGSFRFTGLDVVPRGGAFLMRYCGWAYSPDGGVAKLAADNCEECEGKDIGRLLVDCPAQWRKTRGL